MKISFIIACYNYEKYVGECISSCLGQVGANSNLEVIVIDDGSVDSSIGVISGFSDDRLKLTKIENSGVEKACNIAFSEASGEYIVRVDADDRLAPNYLSHIERYCEHNDFVYSDYTEIDAQGSSIQHINLPEFSREEIMTRGDFLATGTCIRKTIVESIGIQRDGQKLWS